MCHFLTACGIICTRGGRIVGTQDGVQRREVYYSGMVHGVGFRYTTSRVSRRFPVTGYVQNLSDGRVLLVAEGGQNDLDRFLAAVSAEMGRCIHDVQVNTLPATGEFAQFAIRS
ncbi:MAG: acylphosphatase [Thermoguttaceae bacterium]